MHLTEKEILLLEDTDFLLTKAAVINKIYNLLELTRDKLKSIVENSNFSFPDGTDLLNGKISRGENYRNLPYLVLDYPALFTTKTVFAYRTMFWWGNFFSATLHLEGTALNDYRDSISNNIDKLLNKSIYICIGKTPWHYNYGKDNYVPLTENHISLIAACKFLKLSKKIEVNKWNEVPEFALSFFDLLISNLKRSTT